MLPKNSSKMVLLDLSFHRLNSVVQLSMNMESVTLVVPMEEFMFGIKSKSLV
jgi:hypothetical protein